MRQCDPRECASWASLRRFEPWWPWELRLFFIIIIIIIMIIISIIIIIIIIIIIVIIIIIIIIIILIIMMIKNKVVKTCKRFQSEDHIQNGLPL